MAALEARAQSPDDFRCVSLETVFERTTKHAGERAPQQIELRAVEIHQYDVPFAGSGMIIVRPSAPSE